MKKSKKELSRMTRIEIAILDIAYAIENRELKGIYQNTAATLFPLSKKIMKITYPPSTASDSQSVSLGLSSIPRRSSRRTLRVPVRQASTASCATVKGHKVSISSRLSTLRPPVQGTSLSQPKTHKTPRRHQ